MSPQSSGDPIAESDRTDYYKLLNLPTTATPREIKLAYTTLALAFHPDKQTKNPANLKLSEEQFVNIEKAYRILSDPTSRKTFDMYGHKGLAVMNSSPENQKELKVYANQPKLFQRLLDEQIKFDRYRKLDRNLNTSGNLTLSTSLVPIFRGERMFPQMNMLTMQQNVEMPLTDRTTLAFGGYMVERYGLGTGAANISASHDFGNSTSVSSELVFGHKQKIAFSSSRRFSSEIHGSARMQFSPQEGAGFRCSTSRAMSRSMQIQCSLGAGAYSGLNLSCTKALENKTAVVTDFNMGSSDISIRAYLDKKFDEKHSGKVRVKIGTRGMDLAFTSSRIISKFTRLSTQLKFDLATGISWTMVFRRGQMSLILPLFVSVYINPFISLFAASVPVLLDEIIVEILKYGETDDEREIENKKIVLLKRRVKERSDSMSQQKLMEGVANKKRISETEKKGLVILSATYGCGENNAEETRDLDVTVPLQFFVNNSSLTLPGGSKNSILGFHHVGSKSDDGNIHDDEDDDERGRLYNLTRLYVRSRAVVPENTPKCYVRYSYQGMTYEVTFEDDDEINLPTDRAMMMGASVS